jgi:hypothetical protein
MFSVTIPTPQARPSPSQESTAHENGTHSAVH